MMTYPIQNKLIILVILSIISKGYGFSTRGGECIPASNKRNRFLIGNNNLCISSSRIQAKDSSSEEFCNNNGRKQLSQSSRRHLLSNIVVGATAAVFSPSVGSNNAAYASEVPALPTLPKPTRTGGVSSRIRMIGDTMDLLQRDLMEENWELVEEYPLQLRSFVPLLTFYTDSAFSSDDPTDKALRVALRYEVGRFFRATDRLTKSISKRSLDDAFMAYADMSLHFDRYLRVGGLYTYYDEKVSNEVYFKGISNDQLIYANPEKDPAKVRDLVLLAGGPDKGKTGILIGIYPGNADTGKVEKCVVKLDRYKGMREIIVVPRLWTAKRLGEQTPDDVFLLPNDSFMWGLETDAN